jgi:STE24 endopeptidase
MPVSLLIAIVVSLVLRLPTTTSPLASGALWDRIAWATATAFCLGLLATVVGRAISRRIQNRGYPDRRSERLFTFFSRTLVWICLPAFVGILWLLDWVRVVDWGLRARDVPVLEESLILAPYLCARFLVWLGLSQAEMRLRFQTSWRALAHSSWQSIRRSIGIVLPVMLIYLPGRDQLRGRSDSTDESILITFLGMSGMSVGVFLLAPIFVRIAWPTRPLPPGPLRDRLTTISRRLGFRCSDLLIWETDGAVVNAGVTGCLPWFRYVLLSDAMIDRLPTPEIESVFGHEVGHHVLRHLPYYALFFLGSAGLSSLLASVIEKRLDAHLRVEDWISDPALAEICKAVLLLAIVCLFLLAVFGVLSRRFEREADLFGARIVSCGNPDCPPHADPNERNSAPGPIPSLCPAGANLMADSLLNVALSNGMKIETKEWRHGSIAGRIEFLRQMGEQPQKERQFEKGTWRLKWMVLLGLSALSLVTWAIS